MITFRAAKLLIRDPIAKLLQKVPDSWLRRVRRNYFRAPSSSIAGRLLSLAMKVVRYREIDRSIESFEVAGLHPIRLRNCSSVIARKLYWLGSSGWEPAELDLWTRYCGKARNILELGANIGYYTVSGGRAASSGARYTAVEAHPRTSEILRANVRLNELSNVSIIESAVVAGGERTIELYVPRVDTDEAPAMAFVRGAGDPDFGTGDFVTVRCVAIQDLIAGVDLLKLDIEGHELAVLEPIEDQLVASRPTIFIEVLDNMLPLQSFLDSLVKRAGYHAFALTDAGPVKLNGIAGRKLLRELGTRDLVLTMDEVLPRAGVDAGFPPAALAVNIAAPQDTRSVETIR